MFDQSKTLPASLVKNSFGAIVNQVHQGRVSEVIVENHGEPIVAIIPIKDLKIMKEFKQKQKQKDALARLRNLRSNIQARIKGKLNDREAEIIAHRFSREFVEDLEKEGKIKFEKNTPG